MKFTITEKKVHASAALREYAEKKIGKLDRFFRLESEASILFTSERARHIVEVTLQNNGIFYRVTEATSDMFASVDSAVAAIERQIRKHKTRLAKRLRAGELEFEPNPGIVSDDAADNEEETEFQIVRKKSYPIKPMTAEEAILQMRLLGHEFFVFKNQDNADAFTVVYARKNGGYGLIESEVAQ
ncbi:MAG: ribosome-associated translation inhibitor RaiA [Oscillospiraceae bacterium]|jgi:putative sigma-54 modulation protein|nr:ribosome-associated translation inhibitor RaiA [Oscillospiraceae bacterium]